MTNVVLSSAVAASWTNPKVKEARSKRYACALKVGKRISEFSSVPKALRSLGINSGFQTIRAQARDQGCIELDVDGQKVLMAVLEKE